MDNMEIEIKKLNRSMLITRIFCLIPAVLFVIILIGGIYIWGEISGIVDEAMSAMEALNKTLGRIDAGELNEAVENLNDAAEAIRKITSIFK